MNNFACVCYGDKYPVEYVQKLYNMVTRNMFVIEEPFCKNDRFYKSAVPYMSRMLNGVFLSKKKE